MLHSARQGDLWQWFMLNNLVSYIFILGGDRSIGFTADTNNQKVRTALKKCIPIHLNIHDLFIFINDDQDIFKAHALSIYSPCTDIELLLAFLIARLTRRAAGVVLCSLLA